MSEQTKISTRQSSLSSNTHSHLVSLLTPLFKEQPLSPASPPVQASMTPFLGFCNASWLFSGASPSHRWSSVSKTKLATPLHSFNWSDGFPLFWGQNELPVAMDPLNDLSFLLPLPSLSTSCCKCHNYWLALSLRHKIHELLKAMFLAWNILHPFCLISTSPFLDGLLTNSPVLRLLPESLFWIFYAGLCFLDEHCYVMPPPHVLAPEGKEHVHFVYFWKSPLYYNA